LPATQPFDIAAQQSLDQLHYTVVGQDVAPLSSRDLGRSHNQSSFASSVIGTVELKQDFEHFAAARGDDLGSINDLSQEDDADSIPLSYLPRIPEMRDDTRMDVDNAQLSEASPNDPSTNLPLLAIANAPHGDTTSKGQDVGNDSGLNYMPSPGRGTLVARAKQRAEAGFSGGKLGATETTLNKPHSMLLDEPSPKVERRANMPCDCGYKSNYGQMVCCDHCKYCTLKLCRADSGSALSRRSLGTQCLLW